MVRHLNLTPESFEALPWHRRRELIEGLAWEFSDEESGESGESASDFDALGALGITVRQA